MQFLHILFSFILPHLLQPLTAVNAISPEELASAYSSDYAQSTRRLFLFENDGVLRPAGSRAQPEERLSSRLILFRLSADPKNEVWVISAQPLDILEGQYLDIPRLNLAGEMGAKSRRYDEPATFNYDDLATPTNELAKKLSPFVPGLESWAPGSIIFEHQGKTDDNTLSVLALMESPTLSHDFNYVNHPKFAALTHNECDKGRLASTLLTRYTHNYNFVMSLGDTQVDVPMFKALKKHSNTHDGVKAVTVSVGPQALEADASLESHHAVYTFLNQILRTHPHDEILLI